MGDIIPSLSKLEEAIGNTSRLDDTTTVLETGVDSSPEDVALEDTTPALTVPAGAATVEGCNDALVDSCMVAFFEAAKLGDTPAELDSTPTPTELELGVGDMSRGTVADGNKSDVFTAETVSLRLGTPEGETADESEAALVWLTATPTELENEEDCTVKFTTELLR